MLIAESQYEVEHKGGNVKIKVLHNIDFTYNIESEWITAIETRALSDSTLTFSVSENTYETERVGLITFTSVDNTISQVVQIRQKSVPTETNGTTDEIWYTTTDNNIVDVKSKDWSGATIISNTYENGKGIIKFSKEICHIEGWALQKSHNLLSVTLPQTITSIGDGAFY